MQKDLAKKRNSAIYILHLKTMLVKTAALLFFTFLLCLFPPITAPPLFPGPHPPSSFTYTSSPPFSASFCSASLTALRTPLPPSALLILLFLCLLFLFLILFIWLLCLRCPPHSSAPTCPLTPLPLIPHHFPPPLPPSDNEPHGRGRNATSCGSGAAQQHGVRSKLRVKGHRVQLTASRPQSYNAATHTHTHRKRQQRFQ